MADVWRKGEPIRGVRAAFAAALSVQALSLAACGSASSYAGIPLAAGAGDPILQDLARRAEQGDKRAQLDLGMRYRVGNGVPVDERRARKLLALAAADSGTRMMYVPSSRPGGRPMTVPVDQGGGEAGLSEARQQLAVMMKPRSTKLRPSKIRVAAEVIRAEKIDSKPFCLEDPPFSKCSVYRLILAQASPVPSCPFIAISYYDDNGHRYVDWPEPLVQTENEKWTLTGKLQTRPYCYYALIYAREES